MFICGEPFPVEVLDYCESRLKIKDIYNFYGLTETGVENFYYPCIKGDAVRFSGQGFIPIGQPLEGNHVRIDSENSELMISGPQITPGYLGGREAERFEIVEGVRWFRTGDIAKIDGGEYFLKGRVDSQVKLSGFRVELMDIESHIRRSGIREAVCFLHKKDQNTTLCCMIECDSPVDPKVLNRLLKTSLPDYMIPKKYMTVPELPRNRNGKIDRPAAEKLYEKEVPGYAPVKP
jgi:D-alanine--poly(phosphoribitol) ligase subunit 1